MQIGVIAKLKVKEGMNAEFEALFKQLATAVEENEPGNNIYELHKSKSDSQLYIVLEQYIDEEALAAHDDTVHVKTLGAQLIPCLVSAPDIEFMIAV
jgi:quinol monooxygenase YgiN